MQKYIVRWQEWTVNQDFVHDYIPFDYADLLKQGRTDVINRFEECLSRFKKLSPEEQKKGIIFGGVQFDFSFSLAE